MLEKLADNEASMCAGGEGYRLLRTYIEAQRLTDGTMWSVKEGEAYRIGGVVSGRGRTWMYDASRDMFYDAARSKAFQVADTHTHACMLPCIHIHTNVHIYIGDVGSAARRRHTRIRHALLVSGDLAATALGIGGARMHASTHACLSVCMYACMHAWVGGADHNR